MRQVRDVLACRPCCYPADAGDSSSYGGSPATSGVIHNMWRNLWWMSSV